MNRVNRKIRIAVQNKGRLMEPSLDYLKRCGIEFTLNGRNFIASCSGGDFEILFVRNIDIPKYVQYGVVNFGIVGQNILMEEGGNFEVVKKLKFGKCKMVIAALASSKITSVEELEHERIATSYPRILKKFLKARTLGAAIVEIQGSVEICPALGLADAIFDITQTGRTLEENGLQVIEKVADSQAVLIKNPNSNLIYENLFVQKFRC